MTNQDDKYLPRKDNAGKKKRSGITYIKWKTPGFASSLIRVDKLTDQVLKRGVSAEDAHNNAMFGKSSAEQGRDDYPFICGYSPKRGNRIAGGR